ncbi:hypothetical protein SCG7086_BC_00040 [Chlamydiales bacterium SCGC AG-110-P3]|nr:hypothetical protein SCG7086_BC_00040 [Chlamydiales bacterium SCGC AG-110-P3]
MQQYVDSLKGQTVRLITWHDGKSEGLGHLASSYDVLETFMQLGFKGEIEVLCKDSAHEDMKIFYPDFPNDCERDGIKIKYVSIDMVREEGSPPLAEVPLTLMGGFDGSEAIAESTPGSHYSERFLIESSAAVLALNPPGWHAPCAAQIRYDSRHSGRGRNAAMTSNYKPDGSLLIGGQKVLQNTRKGSHTKEYKLDIAKAECKKAWPSSSSD